MRTSLGRSPSACIPTIVASALHVTLPLDPRTIAGTWKTCLPSNAEYIGSNATIRPPSVQPPVKGGGAASGAGDAGDDVELHALTPAASAQQHPTAIVTARAGLRSSTSDPSTEDVLDATARRIPRRGRGDN